MLPPFYRIPLAGLLSLLFCAPLLGQQVGKSLSLIDCGTTELNPQQRQALEAQSAFALRIKQATQGKAITITYVPIRPHIIRRSNGTDGYSLKSLNNVMALNNSYYLKNGVGIQFYFAGTTPDFVDNDALFAVFTPTTSETAIASRSVSNAMNQYYVQSFSIGIAGYAYYPANALASTQSFIEAQNNDDFLGNKLVPHELGHSFNLIHTFEPANGYELITRGAGANCTTAGDLVCDTPADPYGRFPGASSTCVSGCPTTYSCGFTEPGTGAVYAPSPINIMSYYEGCTNDFTPGQYDRLDAGLALRQSHTAYSLTAVSTNVTPASNLTAVITNGLVSLNWTDNANNEMGYFIERSTTLASAGFVPLGGVAPNVTTFTDASAPSFVQAYYRVRPSNSTGGISTIISAVTPACRPTYGNACRNIGLNGFGFNGLTLSQNTGCASITGYSQYTVTSATVTAGQSYPFSVTLLSGYAGGITIWADLNRNGLFSDAGERLFQTPVTVTGSFSGSLTIPASTSAGTLAVRVMSAYSYNTIIPNDPCGSYVYGETEDYRLTVTGDPSCTVMTTTKVGNWNDPTVWSCNRIPVSTDAVLVGHLVTVPTNAICNALTVSYTASGKILFNTGGKLNLGSSN